MGEWGDGGSRRVARVADPGRWARPWSGRWRWRPRVGAVVYLAVVAGMVFVLISVFTPYLVRQPNRGVLRVALDPTVLATWQGPEEAAFSGVLRQFQQQHAIEVRYESANQDIPQWLNNALAQGSVPDVAFLPQPGELDDLARRGSLVPLDPIVDRRSLADMNPLWRRYSTWNGRLYGVYFKASEKSVIWYRPDLFHVAHVQGVPATWADLLTDLDLLRAAGITPFAMCGASAWTLTDWFENLYLRSAGPTAYEGLAQHTLRWTDPSVARALGLMAQAFSPDDMAGGVLGALTTSWPECVSQAFAPASRTAMVFEGDFVQSEIQSLALHVAAGPGGYYDFFRFPTVDPHYPAGVVVGGDVAVMLRDTPQARELISYLATPDAGRVWAQQGGFISPHASVRASSYPGPLSRALAAAVTDHASMLEFDMSDQAPAAFGSTIGAGELAALQQWVSDPTAIGPIQEQLEREAAQAYPPS